MGTSIRIHNLQQENERLRAEMRWAADTALAAFRGDIDETEALSAINNRMRGVLPPESLS